MKRYFGGGIAALVLGVTLIVSGASGPGLTVGTTPSATCGQPLIGITLQAGCPYGNIAITKVVQGTGTLPAGGWSFTITSDNCFTPGMTSGPSGFTRTVTVTAAGGTTSTGPFYATAWNGSTFVNCDYTVTETAVAGWTTTVSPSGVFHLGTSLVSPAANDRTVTVTNTGVLPTTTAPTSTAPRTTATSTAAATVSVSPSSSAAPLAATGASHLGGTALAGAGLVAFGAALLFAGYRRRSREH